MPHRSLASARSLASLGALLTAAALLTASVLGCSSSPGSDVPGGGDTSPEGGGAADSGSSGAGSRHDAGSGSESDGASGTTPGHDGGASPHDSGSTSTSDGATTPIPDGGPAPGSGDGGWWQPSNTAPGHFHWQLSTTFTAPADEIAGQGTVVYDIDGESNDAATVAALHALGPNVKVVCYVDVGTYENFRSDASQFPASVLGASNGWPGEQWLDVRQQSILLPIMKARLTTWCLDKGFDAVEPDNLDGYENDSGFPLTQAENVSYDEAIAAMAHSLGLSVGLKNLPDNADAMEPSFDWALDEQCFQYQECDSYDSNFLAKGKAVWDVEYSTKPDCSTATSAKMNAELRDLNLVGPGTSGYVYTPCIADSQSTW